MTTWQAIFGLEDPVRGELSEFTAARTSFEQMREDAQTIQDTFSRFLDAGQYTGKLEGDTATMFAQMLTELDNGLGDLPRVAGEARDIFDEHVGDSGGTNTLTWLIDEADAALARAVTADSNLDSLGPQRSALEGQISQLNDDIDNPANEDRVDALDSDRSAAQGDLSGVDDDISANEGVLDAERERWTTLREAEDSLNEETGDRLHGIDLGNLEDPGFWDKLTDFVAGVFEWVGEFAVNFVQNVVDLVVALAEGRFMDALWSLKGILDAALLVLGTIALFTGIGAPLFFLAVGALAVTATLAAAQHPNPQTGQVLGFADVAFSGLGVVLSSAGFLRTVGGPNGFRLFTQTTMRGRNAAGTRFASVLSGTRAPGAISALRTNFHNASRLRVAPRSSTRAILNLPRGHVWPTSPGAQNLLLARAGGRTVWNTRGAVSGVYNAGAPITSQFDDTANPIDDGVGSVFESRLFGGANGDAYTGNVEPRTEGARRIVLQARRDPNTQIVPMP